MSCLQVHSQTASLQHVSIFPAYLHMACQQRTHNRSLIQSAISQQQSNSLSFISCFASILCIFFVSDACSALCGLLVYLMPAKSMTAAAAEWNHAAVDSGQACGSLPEMMTALDSCRLFSMQPPCSIYFIVFRMQVYVFGISVAVSMYFFALFLYCSSVLSLAHCI